VEINQSDSRLDKNRRCPMKRTFAVMIAVMFIVGFVTTVNAATKLLPAGSIVSAAISGDTATVNITGVMPKNVEFYSYEGVKSLGSVNTFTVNLREGRRFNFVYGEGTYALLTPDMITYPPDFVGPGIAIDNSDPRGCAFIIVRTATRK
jgi:hypothetical protein